MQLALKTIIEIFYQRLGFDKVIKWKAFEGVAPDIREGGADEVVDERSDHSEAGLPRRVDDAVQHTLCRKQDNTFPCIRGLGTTLKEC